LIPLNEGPAPEFVKQLSDQPFAVLERHRLEELARTLPDAQSAVLLCLTWYAARQERLKRGAHAGKCIARLSGPQLADITGRPLRTIRYAISTLRRCGVIEPLSTGPGKTAVYRLHLTLTATEDVTAQRKEQP
jgi:hypothetical protein